ncbi:MAG: dihydroxyacetone kinase subunit L [Dysgonamonadaceae bacterium]|jgi:dihydroxyacetone kinase-like protein|nr:dihydroxyacetone kinase subunit L [Dysgonamonadaceae bacterium]
MNTLTTDNFRAMLQRAYACIKAREDEFSKLDAITGDGDHGTAIVSAFSAAIKASEKDADFKTMLNDMGFAIMMETSGSTSTLLGAFFLGMSNGCAGNELDANGVKALFNGGLANVRKQTKADVGDKTMMDALIPAVKAMDDCSSDDIADLLSAAAKAAKKSAEDTIDMIAKFGRARNYGERSKGSMDSGAASWATMFGAFAG